MTTMLVAAFKHLPETTDTRVMSATRAHHAFARRREEVAERRQQQMAPFRQRLRPEIRTEDELAAFTDWGRPPVLRGEGHFNLDQIAKRVGADTELLIEARDRTHVFLSGAKARIVARDHSQICAAGEDVEVWASGQSKVEASGRASVYARGRAAVDVAEAHVNVDGQSRCQLHGGGASAFGHSRVVLHRGTVSAGDQAEVVIGVETGRNPSEEALGFEDYLRPTVIVSGAVTVKIRPDSDPCVLLLFDPAVNIVADRVPPGWWAETFARTEAFVGRNRPLMGDPLSLLRDVRFQFDEDFRNVEKAATWRPLKVPRRRVSELAK
jgi:hypothetical protein